MGGGNPCPFEKFDVDEQHCIFHSNLVDKKRSTFEKELKLYIEKIKSDPKIEAFDFTRFAFPAFSFHGTTFEKPVIFLQSRFVENADFSGVVFKNMANFQGCELLKGGSFSRTKFMKMANFIGTNIARCWFDEAEFLDVAVFKSAKFQDFVHFLGAKFNNAALFSEARFKGNANFGEATFKGHVHFDDVEFDDITVFLYLYCPT